MKTSFLVLAVLALGLPFITGCSMLLEGEGRMGLSMDSKNSFYLFHSAETDKKDNDAKSTLEADSVLDIITGQAERVNE